jgi:hypothetical protein
MFACPRRDATRASSPGRFGSATSTISLRVGQSFSAQCNLGRPWIVHHEVHLTSAFRGGCLKGQDVYVAPGERLTYFAERTGLILKLDVKFFDGWHGTDFTSGRFERNANVRSCGKETASILRCSRGRPQGSPKIRCLPMLEFGIEQGFGSFE